MDWTCSSQPTRVHHDMTRTHVDHVNLSGRVPPLHARMHPYQPGSSSMGLASSHLPHPRPLPRSPSISVTATAFPASTPAPTAGAAKSLRTPKPTSPPWRHNLVAAPLHVLPTSTNSLSLSLRLSATHPRRLHPPNLQTSAIPLPELAPTPQQTDNKHPLLPPTSQCHYRAPFPAFPRLTLTR